MTKEDGLDENKKYPDSVTSKLPREKLPKDLQDLVNKQDDFMDQLYDGELQDSTETNLRYAAYANRVRTIMMSASRYVAYTSDIGESFRPVAHPYLVKGAYGVSWAYLVGDVSYEGYKAYKRNMKIMSPENNEHMKAAMANSAATSPAGSPVTLDQSSKPHIPAIEDWKAVMAQRAVFQSIASMGLPAFTIHSIVKYSGKALKSAANPALRTWGPIGLGLAAVPALPYMFDKPVEEAVEWSFYHAFRTIGGESAVGARHATGRAEALTDETKKLNQHEERLKKEQ
ncbi:hypothetical protein R6Q59_009904 [Mikania micrantha]